MLMLVHVLNGLLTTAEVADLLGVSVATVNRHARSGQLRADAQMPGSKGARLFHPSEVARFRSDMAAEAAS